MDNTRHKGGTDKCYQNTDARMITTEGFRKGKFQGDSEI